MKEPRWLKDAVVEAIHLRQLAEHGGLSGIRDAGLLASALARPKNLSVYGNPKPDIAALAASYAFGIARNHAFVDGNKRTAYVVCRTFLRLNSCDINAEDADKYLTVVGVADGSLSEEALADWICAHVVKATLGC
jgi:death-on-curing protein